MFGVSILNRSSVPHCARRSQRSVFGRSKPGQRPKTYAPQLERLEARLALSVSPVDGETAFSWQNDNAPEETILQVEPSASIHAGESEVMSWENPRDAMDVNDDGVVSPLDVLSVINFINWDRAADWEVVVEPAAETIYFDVSGDGIASAIDVLMIISHLNLPSWEASGENGSLLVQPDSPCFVFHIVL